MIQNRETDPMLLILDGISAIEETLVTYNKEYAVKPSELQEIYERMVSTLHASPEIKKMFTTPQPLDPFVGADITFERDIKYHVRRRRLHELRATCNNAAAVSDVPEETRIAMETLFHECIVRQCALMFPYTHHRTRVIHAGEVMRGIQFLSRCLSALAALRGSDGPIEMIFPFDY